MTDHRSAHAGHDRFLVASHAAGDLSGAELETATRQVAECAECASLHADIRALARVTRDLPTPSRPRDFRLTPEDAARLRRTGWRRWWHALAGPSFAFARPVGAALSTLGLAGLLLATLPAVQLGGSAAAPGASGGEYTPAAAPGGGDTSGEQGGEPRADQEHLNGAGASFAPVRQEPGEEPGAITDLAARAAEAAQRSADSALVILSGSFLIVGLGLFGLRWSARRLGDG